MATKTTRAIAAPTNSERPIERERRDEEKIAGNSVSPDARKDRAEPRQLEWGDGAACHQSTQQSASATMGRARPS